jgi:hypothetical protein
VVSMLDSGAQDRGFEPGRNRRIFRAKKIHNMPSFGGEVKPSFTCRRLKNPVIYVEVGITGKIDRIFLALVPSFANRGLSCRMTWSASGDDGGTKWWNAKGLQL